MKTREEIYKELVKQYLIDNSQGSADYLTRKANIYAVQNTNEVYYSQFK